MMLSVFYRRKTALSSKSGALIHKKMEEVTHENGHLGGDGRLAIDLYSQASVTETNKENIPQGNLYY